MLISLSQAIEPVGGYTTESVTHGQCDARPTVTFLVIAFWPILIVLGEQKHIMLSHSLFLILSYTVRCSKF